MSPYFLKPHFLELIKDVLETGVFPQSEKNGIIYPILKSHDLDLENLANYRPITNISYIAKLIETGMYEQLSEYALDNGLIPSCQSAYRSDHSTETALTRVYSDIIYNLDQNKHTLTIFLDLSTAFDCIDHE